MTIQLICPLCQSPLQPIQRQWQCANRHSFDTAKQGHINLLPVQQKRTKQPGDSKEMVAARRLWLEQGYYAPVANQLALLVDNDSTVLDAGCGEGYYLQQLMAQKSIVAVGNDISKFACEAAAKRCKQATILVASNKAIPLADHSLETIICAFGFPVLSEFKRLLKPQGKLILAHSTSHHLHALRAALYEEVHEKPDTPLADELVCVDEQQLDYSLENLNSDEVLALAKMTPHWFRAKQDKRDQLVVQPPTSIEVSVRFQVCEFAT